MRELKVGEATLPVKATPLSLLFYRQEFGSDMTKDFLTVMKGFISMFPGASGKNLEDLSELDVSGVTMDSISAAEIDTLGVLKLVWAMAKAGCYPEPWPRFEPWVASLDGVTVLDESFFAAALEVAADGLFRGGSPAPRR